MKTSHYIWLAVVLIAAVGIALAKTAPSNLTATSFNMMDGGMDMFAYEESAEPSFGIYDSRVAPEADTTLYPAPTPSAGQTAGEAEARIIQTGYVSIQVNDVYASVDELVTIAQANDGFAQSTNAGENPNGSRYGHVTIRVPSANYQATLNQIREAGVRVLDESSDAQDVTEQYTDLETRLTVAREEEQAYLALLDRANTVSELLEVQRELSNVRVRIESLEGQLQYLENRTSYSTITVSLQETAGVDVPTKPFQPDQTIKNALQSVVVAFQFLAEAIIWIVILGVGVVLPVSLIAWAIRYGIKRARKN